MRAFEMSQIHECIRLVKNHPVRNPVAQRLRHQLHVIGKAACRIAVGPTARIFQRLRQVPVIERNQRTDARFQQSVYESAVVIDTLGIRRTRS